MNSRDALDIVEQAMDAWAESLLKRLQPVRKGSRSPGSIRSGSWKNPQNLILGWVSFSPHQNAQEESIDATVSVSLVPEQAQMSADISWSDGELIHDYGEYGIRYSSLEQLIQNIQKTCDKFDEEIFQAMAELIQSDLPPRYRMD